MTKELISTSQAKGLGDIVAYINAFRTTQTLQDTGVPGELLNKTREKEDISDEGGRDVN